MSIIVYLKGKFHEKNYFPKISRLSNWSTTEPVACGTSTQGTPGTMQISFKNKAVLSLFKNIFLDRRL